MRVPNRTARAYLRWAHIVAGALLAAFVYSLLREVEGFVFLMQFVLIPGLILTGVWMSQQARVRWLLGRARAGSGVRAVSSLRMGRYESEVDR